MRRPRPRRRGAPARAEPGGGKQPGGRNARGFRLACRIRQTHDISLAQDEVALPPRPQPEDPAMPVILTSKPGQFRTAPTPGLTPVETYDCLFHESRGARFVIAGTPRIRVDEEGPAGLVDSLPCKFLQHFGTVQARLEPVAA